MYQIPYCCWWSLHWLHRPWVARSFCGSGISTRSISHNASSHICMSARHAAILPACHTCILELLFQRSWLPFSQQSPLKPSKCMIITQISRWTDGTRAGGCLCSSCLGVLRGRVAKVQRTGAAGWGGGESMDAMGFISLTVRSRFLLS